MVKRLSDKEWEREADRLLNEECDRIYREAGRESIEAMLIVKFGTIDPELKALVPKLILLDPLARTQQIMTLSREALLESQ
jgi:hypothetical protein